MTAAATQEAAAGPPGGTSAGMTGMNLVTAAAIAGIDQRHTLKRFGVCFV
jgi:hypothetical protein